MIAPRPLECTCWRQFTALWGDCKKSRIAPLDAIIIIIIIIILWTTFLWFTYHRLLIMSGFVYCQLFLFCIYVSLQMKYGMALQHFIMLDFMSIKGFTRIRVFYCVCYGRNKHFTYMVNLILWHFMNPSHRHDLCRDLSRKRNVVVRIFNRHACFTRKKFCWQYNLLSNRITRKWLRCTRNAVV